jgi:hypothetical protein
VRIITLCRGENAIDYKCYENDLNISNLFKKSFEYEAWRKISNNTLQACFKKVNKFEMLIPIRR